jgi:hypothetical protein
MRGLWKIIVLTFKVIGKIFDFVEPYAMALDDPIAWLLTAASCSMGLAMVWTGVLAGGINLAVLGIAWLLVAYLLCPFMKWGTWEKAIACGISMLLLKIMEKAAGS